MLANVHQCTPVLPNEFPIQSCLVIMNLVNIGTPLYGQNVWPEFWTVNTETCISGYGHLVQERNG